MSAKSKVATPVKRRKKMGRPPEIAWSSFHSWRTKTTNEIARLLQTSVPNVYIKRRKLIAAAIEKGQDPTKYICKHPKWTRGRDLATA